MPEAPVRLARRFKLLAAILRPPRTYPSILTAVARRRRVLTLLSKSVFYPQPPLPLALLPSQTAFAHNPHVVASR